MIGRRISRFRILEELGRGGMATVWKATDELLNRPVALKMLLDPLSQDATARRRFRREAEISALLEHPSIVPVYEAGEHDQQAYLVMKLIEGETLAAFVSHQLPAISVALRIGRHAAAALAYAHARGVIHRDVTARNVMRTSAGDVYVLDFGLARVKGMDSTSNNLAGTYPYLAPEVLEGRSADAQSDLYSLGVVLYETLTGTRPFEGASPEIVQFRSLNTRLVPPSALRPEIGPRIDSLVLATLARDPDRRLGSAEELAGALERLLREADTPLVLGVAPSAPAAAGEPAPDPERATESTEPQPPPETAGAGGELAERLARREARAYLAVLPIEGPPETGPAEAALFQRLAEVACAGLASLERLHVVGLDRHRLPEETLRAYCRRVGANLVLQATARSSGSAIRVSFAIVEPESGRQVGGGVVDGSTHLAFELEDRLVASLRATLGVSARAGAAEWRPRPPDPAAPERFAQAVSYLQRFDNEASLDGAIALLEELIESGGGTATVQATLARAYVQKAHVTQQRVWEGRAASACESAFRLEPDAPDVQLAVGELDLLAGRTERALESVERAIAARPDFYEALLGKARALDALGAGDDAETWCEKAIALRPDDWRGYHRLGLTCFRRGRYAQAIEPWLRVTEITPDNPVAYRNLGSAYFHQDRYVEAEDALRRSIAIRPGTRAYSNLGTVLFFLERHDECVAAFEKAVDLNRGDPIAWGNLGNACRLIPGRETRAREALERAIGLMREQLERADGDGESWARLAGWLVGCGRGEEAEAAIRRALERSPDSVHCLWSAGHVLFLVGRRAEALEYLARAVRSGYGVDALRRDPDLRPLHDDPEFARILCQGPGHHEAA